MGKNNQRPDFESLFTEAEEIDSAELEGLLKPYILIKRDTNYIFFTEQGHQLKLEHKLLLFLLARKVLSLLGKEEKDETPPRTIIETTKLPRGSVLPTLKRLEGKHLAVNIKGNYFVPNYQIHRIKKVLEEGGEKK